jgi:uncharacterized membrane-anchored protein YhcB (DUF1043 family)
MWFVAIIALVAGGVVGFFLPRSSGMLKARGSQQTTNEELEALRDRNASYQREVAAHFDKTAELLGQLLGNYRDVHNHLAQGAERLCADADIRRLQNLPDERLIEQQIPSTLEAPRDYAPKVAAGGKGVLDEDFGIEKIHREATPEPPRY